MTIEATVEQRIWRFSITGKGPTIPVADRERISSPNSAAGSSGAHAASGPA